MEGQDEDNSINRLQEYLQAICPVSGVPPYSCEDRGSQGHWRMRIVLEQTGPSGDEAMPMPWSAAHGVKVVAKKEAARLCLEALRASGARPHNAAQVWKTIFETRGGVGGGDNGPVAAPAECPTLTDDLLAVHPVVCAPGGEAGVDEPGDDDVNPPPPSAASRCFCSGRYECWLCAERRADMPTAPQGLLPPANLGELGELYALKWLQRQPWIKPGSVRWMNESTQAPTRDLECVPLGAPGRRHVEVKTRWRRFKRAGATRAQRVRLLDPQDDYMLLIVGFFENLLPSDGQPPSPPQVRVLPNLKWEDRELDCVWATRRRADLFCHFTSITDGNSLRDGASVHFRRGQRKGRDCATEVVGGVRHQRQPRQGSWPRQGGRAGPGPGRSSGSVHALANKRTREPVLSGVAGPPPEGFEEAIVVRWNAEKGFGFVQPSELARCAKKFLWSATAQQASGCARPGMKDPPALCEPCCAELERTGSELRVCTDCSQAWVFEAGEKRFVEKCMAQAAADGDEYTLPRRCKPCRGRKKTVAVQKELNHSHHHEGCRKNGMVPKSVSLTPTRKRKIGIEVAINTLRQRIEDSVAMSTGTTRSAFTPGVRPTASETTTEVTCSSRTDKKPRCT